jgi:hypothetical protein
MSGSGGTVPAGDRQFGRRPPGQHRDRVLELRALYADRDRLGARALDLGAGQRHVGGRHDPGAVLILADPQRFAEGFDRGVEQPLQRVGDPQLHVGGGKLALRREPRCGEVAGARLRAGDVALDRPPDPAPQIGNPARRPGHAERIADQARARRARALRQRVEFGGREQLGAGLRDDRLGLAELGLGGLQVLVRQLDLRHQPVEHRVLEHRPPRAAVDRIGRLRPAPAFLLLVDRRHRRRRPPVIRPHRAPRQNRQDHHRGERLSCSQ